MMEKQINESLVSKEFVSLDMLLRSRAAEAPTRVAYSFKSDDSEGAVLTLSELDSRARAIAAFLRSRDPVPKLALLVYPPGLEFISAFFGCLYAGCIAIPCPLPASRVLPERLSGIIRDSGASIGLTDARNLERLAALTAREEPLLRWAATNDVPRSLESTTVAARERDAIAFLQYTSGSTGAPRGVVVTHGNIIANVASMQRVFGALPSWEGVTWLPHFHDMGLIGGILYPLHVGFPVKLSSPLDFVRSPARWLRQIREGVRTISGGPNFAYEQCVRKIGPEEKKALQLRDWKIAFCGAEPVQARTLRAFCDAFSACGFSPAALTPVYGLAENTLLVSGEHGDVPAKVLRVKPAAMDGLRVELADDKGRDVVSCGGFEEAALRIVDPETRIPVGSDQIGEIWLRSENVAHGYWKRPRETQATFGATLSGSDEPFLRTGDLGFVRDGELYITGRLKDVIIISGRNLFPEDIEGCALATAPDGVLARVTAFGVEIDAEERLAILAELATLRVDDATDLDALKREIRSAVSTEYGVRVHEVAVVRRGTLPRTSSGKLQRSACVKRYLTGEFSALGGLP